MEKLKKKDLRKLKKRQKKRSGKIKNSAKGKNRGFFGSVGVGSYRRLRIFFFKVYRDFLGRRGEEQGAGA